MNTSSRHPGHSQGFALILTLVLLVIAATVFASVARVSYSKAIEVSHYERKLQQQWLIRSAQASVLDQAQSIFQNEKSPDREQGITLNIPTPRSDKHIIEINFEIAGNQIKLHLQDEQAKANLNTLLKDSKRQAVILKVRPILLNQQFVTQSQLHFDLRPVVDKHALKDVPKIGSLGQIFSIPENVRPDDLRLMTKHVTSYGSGKLNIKRASPQPAQLMLDGIISPTLIHKLTQASPQSETTSIEYLLKNAALSRQEQQKVKDRIVTQSTCYSLWITMASEREQWSHWVVKDQPSSKATAQYLHWSW